MADDSWLDDPALYKPKASSSDSWLDDPQLYKPAKKAEKPGFGETLLKGLQRGGADAIASTIYTVADALDASVQAPARALSPILGDTFRDPLGVGAIASENMGVRQAIDADRQSMAQRIGGRPSWSQAKADPLGSAKQYGLNITNAIGESAPLMAAAIATRNPVLGSAVMGGAVGAQEYTGLRGEGVGRAEAAQAAGLTAAIESAGESFSLPLVLGARARGSLRNAILAESVQEAPVQIAQQYVQDQTLGTQTPIGQQLGDAFDAAITGGVMGGGGHLIAGGSVLGEIPPEELGAAARAAAPKADAPQTSAIDPAILAAGNEALASAAKNAPPAPVPRDPAVAPEPTDDIDALLARNLPPDELPPAAPASASPSNEDAGAAATPEIDWQAAAEALGLTVQPALEAPLGQANPVEGGGLAGAGPAAAGAAEQASAAAGGDQAIPVAPDGFAPPPPTRYSAADMRQLVGWSQRGGELVRAPVDDRLLNEEQRTGGVAQPKGEVIGRTRWTGWDGPDGQESTFWKNRPKGITEAQANAAFDKLERGEPLTAKEQRFIDYADAVAGEYDAAMNLLDDELRGYSEIERQRGIDELRQQHDIAVQEADQAEALSVYELAHRAASAGVDPFDIAQSANEPQPAYAARLWNLIQEAGRGTDNRAAEQDRAGSNRGRESRAQGAAEGFALTQQRAPAEAPAAQEVTRPSAGLFGAPTTADFIGAAKRARDASRNGQATTGRTDMLAGDGELFAGPRPAQAEIPAQSQQQAVRPKDDIDIQREEYEARRAETAKDAAGKATITKRHRAERLAVLGEGWKVADSEFPAKHTFKRKDGNRVVTVGEGRFAEGTFEVTPAVRHASGRWEHSGGGVRYFNDFAEAARYANESSKPVSRNGLGRDVVRPEQGDGELLAGGRPAQAEIPGAETDEEAEARAYWDNRGREMQATPEFQHNGWATRNARLGEEYAAAKKALDDAERPLREARYADSDRLPPGYKTIPHETRDVPNGVALIYTDAEGFERDVAYPLTLGEAADRAWRESGRTDRFAAADAREAKAAPKLEALRAKVKAAQEAWDANGKSPMEPTWEAERRAKADTEQKARETAAKAQRTRAANKAAKAKKPESRESVEELTDADLTPAQRASFERQSIDRKGLRAKLSREQGAADAEASGLAGTAGKLLGAVNVDLVFARTEAGLEGLVTPGYMSQLRDQQKGRKPGMFTAGLYIPANRSANGKPFAVVFTGNKLSPALQLFTAMHEIAGHHGLRALLGDRLNKVLDLAEQNPTVKAVAASMTRQRNLRPDQRYLAIEEALADLAAAVRTKNFQRITDKHGVEVPKSMQSKLRAMLDNIVARIKALFGKQGVAFTDAQVLSLLEAAWQAAQGNQASMTIMGADGALEQVVFHGTPHTVDRFSLQKIGTGEGTQAYGWGLYFASVREIADHYRKALSGDGYGVVRIDGLPQVGDPEFGNLMVLEIGERPPTTLRGAEAYEYMRSVLQQLLNDEWTRDRARLAISYLNQSENAGLSIEVPGRDEQGNLYRVDIPEDSDLLDWDKPLSEQPEKVREALAPVRSLGGFGVVNASVIYSELQKPYQAEKLGIDLGSNPQKAVSEYLNSLGIPGLRYLDGNSRSKGEGSANYVIWDEAAIGTPESALESTEDRIDLTPTFGTRDAKIGDTTITYGVSRDGQTVEVVMVRTPKAKRGGGSARRAMESLLAEADANGQRVVLTAEPMDSATSKTKLQDFYRSLGFKPNSGRSRDFTTRATMIREPQAPLESAEPRVRRKRGEPMSAAERDANFRRWSNNAPLVTRDDAMGYAFKTGQKVVVEAIHGTKRPDRIGKGFNAKRATSGPMPYFTSDAVTGSSYATGKNDTSLSYEDQDFGTWFKVKVPGYRNPLSLDRAWFALPSDVRARISALAPRISTDYETGENIELRPEGHTNGIGNYDWEIKESRGNALMALIEGWLSSGTLYNDEQRFMDVLEMAGMPMDSVTFDSPFAEFPALFPVYVRMRKPLVTNDIPQEVVSALNAAAKRDRSRAATGGADAWDKNTRTLRDWVAAFNEDSGDAAYVWTSIPDKVTDVFRSLGYDGIVDMGGKGGGANHRVYIPFSEGQVKGKFNKGKFDDSKRDLLESVEYTPEQEAALTKAGLQVDRRTSLQRTKDALREKWRAAKEVLADPEAMKQAAFDRFHGLRHAEAQLGLSDPEASAYIAARMSAGLDAAMEAMLSFGAPVWDGGVLGIKDGTVGLLDALKPVEGMVDEWLGWMVGRRAKLLKSQGRENNLTDDDIAALLSLADGREQAFQQAARDYLKIKNAVLDVAEQAGLIDPSARAVWDHAEYIPFYRAEGDGSAGPGTRKGLQGQTSGIRTLKGGDQALADPLANIIRNFTKLVDASMKTRAVLLAVDNYGNQVFEKVGMDMAQALVPLDQVKKHLREQGTPESVINALPAGTLKGVQRMLSIVPPSAEDVVRVMRDGKAEYYRVKDPLVLRALTAFKQPNKNIAIKPFIWFKRLLTTGVTVTPEFIAANFIRDSGSAWVISDDRFKPGWDSMRGVVSTLRNDQTAREMMMAGSTFLGGQFYDGNPDKAANAIRRALRSKGMSNRDIEGFIGTIASTPLKLWDGYLKLSGAVENANRRAVFDAAIKAGRTRTEAAYMARDLMDFAMQGDAAWVQLFSDILPFFNARLQGLYKLGRRAGTKQGKRAILLRGGVITLATVALYAWNLLAHSDGWDELEEWDKDAYWHVAPGTPYHIRIPKPFELGLLFGTAPERGMEAIRNRINQAEGDKPETTLDALIRAITGTLAFNPVPQAALPIAEQWANKRFFTGRPIENMGDEKLLPEDRKEWYTSDTMKALGRMSGISPKRLEHIWNGYTAGMGGYMLDASDVAVRMLEGAPDRPSMNLSDMPLVGRFARGGSPGRTKYGEQFYERLRKGDQIEQSIKSRLEAGDEAGALKLERENADILGERIPSKRAKEGFLYAKPRAMRKVRGELSGIRDEIEAIATSRNVSAEEKRQQINALEDRRNKVFRDAVKSAEQ